MLCKNPVKGADRGKAGLQSYVDNGCFGVNQQSNSIIKPQTVDIGWEGGLQNIVEGTTDVASANTECLGDLLRSNRFKIMLLTVCQYFLLNAQRLLTCNCRDNVNNDGDDGRQQQNKAVVRHIFPVFQCVLNHRPYKTFFLRIAPKWGLQRGCGKLGYRTDQKMWINDQ